MEKAMRDKWLGLPNQRRWKEELQKLLCRSDNAVESALVRIYDLQTPLEKATDMSVQENGFGFNRVDAQFLSKYATMVKMGHHLTKDEVCIVRSRVLKYWKQLMVLSKQKLRQEEQEERAKYESMQVEAPDIAINDVVITTDISASDLDLPVCEAAGHLVN